MIKKEKLHVPRKPPDLERNVVGKKETGNICMGILGPGCN